MFTAEQLLNGVVIPVDKPRQWTSFQAVGKVKAAIRHSKLSTLNSKLKVGHAGTLDPLATGLLLICVGKATKRIPQLQEGEKVYSGTMVLGATTPCYDLERPIDAYYPYEHITPERLEEARRQFLGDIQQVPPIFSAVKIGGQRAYALAQPGQEASPTPKTVHIADFQITAFRPGETNTNAENEHERTNTNLTNLTNKKDSYNSCDSCSEKKDDSCSDNNIRVQGEKQFALYKNPLGSVPPELPQIDFRIRCGKGTYIRSIARDFGLALDSGAFLASLRREQIGDYTLADAIPLEELKIE